MKKLSYFVMVICAVLHITSCGVLDSSEIKLVKTGVLQLCPNHTLDQMVNGFMGSPSWSSGKSSDGSTFVNVEGDITFHEKPVRAMVQFLVNGNGFLFNAMEMNGVPSENLIAIGMLNKMCLSAEGSLQESITEKPKETVAPSPSSVTEQLAATDSAVVGEWKGELGGEGRMEIKPIPTGFNVVLSVSSASGCGGSIEGSGSLLNNTITLEKKDGDQVCLIAIKFSGDKAGIEENNCSFYHGAACGFDGTLVKSAKGESGIREAVPTSAVGSGDSVVSNTTKANVPGCRDSETQKKVKFAIGAAYASKGISGREGFLLDRIPQLTQYGDKEDQLEQELARKLKLKSMNDLRLCRVEIAPNTNSFMLVLIARNPDAPQDVGYAAYNLGFGLTGAVGWLSD